MSNENYIHFFENLPLPQSKVVDFMRKHLDDDKILKQRTKVEMNRFLGRIIEEVCEELNKFPYTVIEYKMLEECIRPYLNAMDIPQEKKIILEDFDAIKAYCDVLAKDIEKTYKIKDAMRFEEDEKFVPFTSEKRE